METMLFDELLAQVEAECPWENVDPDELQVARRAQFDVSEAYKQDAEVLLNLVEPLLQAFPNELEYQRYARAHAGLKAGPGTEPYQTPKGSATDQMLRTKNPVYVYITEDRRSGKDDSEHFPHLDDEEYSTVLDAVEYIGDWWEHNTSTTALELAKSVIVHTVLANKNLRAKALLLASDMIDQAIRANWIITDWREAL